MNHWNVLIISLLLFLLFAGTGAAIAAETYGDILVKSDPAGAVVTLDGTLNTYQTPYQYYGIRTGRHTLTVSKPGYLIYTNNDVVVSPGMVTSIYAVLIKDPNYGTIRVSSYPAGADVYVDGALRGKTIESKGVDYKTDTLFISGLPDGVHTVLLKLNGYKEITQTVETGTGKVGVGVVSVTMVSLAPKPTPDMSLTPPPVPSLTVTPVSTPAGGTLMIESVPSGAQVLMNGTVQGITPKRIDGLQAGTYTFSIQLVGYTPVTIQADIRSGQFTNKTIGLVQARTPASTPPSTPVPTAPPTPAPPPAPTRTQASGSPLAVAGLVAGLLILGIFFGIFRK